MQAKNENRILGGVALTTFWWWMVNGEYWINAFTIHYNDRVFGIVPEPAKQLFTYHILCIASKREMFTKLIDKLTCNKLTATVMIFKQWLTFAACSSQIAAGKIYSIQLIKIPNFQDSEVNFVECVSFQKKDSNVNPF